jgi:hypothetical protein
MMMETSKTESLGATKSIELVVPEVWSIGWMMIDRKKTFPVLSEIPYELPLLNL